MKKLLLLLLITVGCTVLLKAQNPSLIKGTVVDDTSLPMVGVTITIKGTNKTTISDSNGSFSINADRNSVLVFQFMGFRKLELALDGKTEIKATMQTDDKILNEIVVVGYGTQKRKDLTGAIASVSGAEIAKVPVQNVAQALQGRLAGVQVTMSDGSPGSSPSIKIRGGTSITQSNEPLYVVDGVPQTDGLAFLDPMDIESIDVLKDASSTAIYGARGANGVVLVTTKQIKSGKVAINYEGYVGAKKITNEIPVMNAYQYLLLDYERSLGNATLETSFANRYGAFDQLQANYGNRSGKNWQKEVFGSTVYNQYHKVSLNGGGADTKFNLFFANNSDEGIMINSASKKNIGKLTLNQKVGQNLTVNTIVNVSNQKITGLPPTEGGNARLTVLQTLLQYRPVNSLNEDDDQLLDLQTDPFEGASTAAFQSPIVSAQTRLRNRIINTLNANTSVQYKLSKKLTYRGLINYTLRDNKYKEFNEARSIVAIRSGGPFGSISNAKDIRFNYNNTLTYSQTFAKEHKLDVTAGQEYIYNYSENFRASASNFPAVNNGWDNLSLGTVVGVPSSYAEDDKLLSFFGRLNYSYGDKYLLTATLRADGSSKFGVNNQWGYFPSVALAWRVINEDFMKKAPVFSDLKLRVSYGQSGNNRIPNYTALGTYTTGLYPINNTNVLSAFQNNLPNPFLQWEANESVNVGLDMGFLKQRITLTTEWYDNRSKNLLFDVRIPGSTGFSSQFQNIGKTASKGLEFSLNTVNITGNGFNWSTNFNIAFNKTKVLELSEGENFKIVSSYTDINDFILQVGKPVGTMYGYLTDGLYQVSDFDYNSTTNTYTLKNGVVKDNRTVQPGYQKFKDISGPNGVPDGVISDADRTIIGNANPKYTGGIGNSFSYKGIDLSVFLNFSVGGDIYNANVLNNSALSNQYKNSLQRFANRWTTINAAGARVTDPTELAALNQGKTVPSYVGIVSDRPYNTLIEDGSFLRINNVSLGYTFPKELIQKIKLSNARIYFTAYNLHVFTKYSGYDPEVSTVNNAITPGVDFSAYPRAKSFVFGLNLSL